MRVINLRTLLCFKRWLQAMQVIRLESQLCLNTLFRMCCLGYQKIDVIGTCMFQVCQHVVQIVWKNGMWRRRMHLHALENICRFVSYTRAHIRSPWKSLHWVCVVSNSGECSGSVGNMQWDCQTISYENSGREVRNWSLICWFFIFLKFGIHYLLVFELLFNR